MKWCAAEATRHTLNVLYRLPSSYLGSRPLNCRSPDALDAYRQPVAGFGDRPYLPARNVVLREVHSCRRQQVMEEALRLHIGEMQAQTHVRASAKGHPGILVTRADGRIGKAQRVELER